MSETTSENSTIFPAMVLLMGIVALILPFAFRIDVGPGPDSIRAMVWDYIESSWYSGFRIWNPIDTLPYTFLRLVFALYLARLYVGRATSRRTILIGILAELQPFAVSAPLVYFIDWSGDPLVPLYIPLPIMFIFGVALILILTRRNKND